MKFVTELPAGNWSLIFFRGDVIAVCPEHAPRIIDSHGTVQELKPRFAAESLGESIQIVRPFFQ